MIESPLPGFRFIVTLDPGDAYLPVAQALFMGLVALGGFQEVDGLGGELEVLAHPEGGRNNSVHQLPVRHSWSRLTLKRGVVRDPMTLWAWYEAGLNQSLGARRDGSIILLSALGVPAVAWVFRGGLAAKWTGPSLNAQSDALAIESLEVAHQSLERVFLTPPIPEF